MDLGEVLGALSGKHVFSQLLVVRADSAHGGQLLYRLLWITRGLPLESLGFELRF